MNVEELDRALRQINGNLISTRECQYLKFVRFSLFLFQTILFLLLLVVLDSSNSRRKTIEFKTFQFDRCSLGKSQSDRVKSNFSQLKSFDHCVFFRPFVRKLINKFDYEALDIKMQKAKVVVFFSFELIKKKKNFRLGIILFDG